jgi:hypothetical protein
MFCDAICSDVISIDIMCPQFGKIFFCIVLVVMDDDNQETLFVWAI